MSFTDIIKDSVLEGFNYSDISSTKIVITLLIAYAIAMYIHLVYKIATKNAFYYRNYAISMTIMSVITAGIILAMQSSLVISLGMVGALSIVRFRTAIKDPMDLLFLFWSIQRYNHAGVWQEWEWNNPRMIFGIEYRTTERWNGQIVYSKLVDLGTLPNCTFKDVSIGSNIVNLVDLRVSITNSAPAHKLLSSNESNVYAYVMWNSKIRIYSLDTDSSDYSGCALIKYTKQ